jgi:hypothetical protein
MDAEEAVMSADRLAPAWSNGRLKQTDVAISANGPRRTYTRPRELAGGAPLVVSLAVSQTQDVRDDAVDIIIFDHKIWHCTVRGVQCGSECGGCHSGGIRNSCERWRLLICRAAIVFYG